MQPKTQKTHAFWTEALQASALIRLEKVGWLRKKEEPDRHVDVEWRKLAESVA